MSNQELARIYRKVNSVYNEGMYARTMYNRIFNAKVNIYDFYKQNGTLSDCPVSGLGFGKLSKTHVTKRILELILESGENIAYETISKEREAIKKTTYSSPRRFNDKDIDDNDSFYDSYKRRYG